MSNKLYAQNTLIFTDLDGTLLDHDSYSFEAALEMLDYIKSKKIPLIIVTSKTKSEVIELQKKLKINSPFIIENGAGIFMPKGETYELISLGFSYEQTLEAFNRYAKEISVFGFSQMVDEQVANLTGLPLESARLAKQRTFSEPFMLEDESHASKLKELAKADGFDIVKGGRFYHLITQGQDKAAAVLKTKALYEEKNSKSYTTVALGDGENDISMLSCVDNPILIPRFDGTYIDFELSNLTKAKYPGPKGWNNSIKKCFDV